MVICKCCNGDVSQENMASDDVCFRCSEGAEAFCEMCCEYYDECEDHCRLSEEL